MKSSFSTVSSYSDHKFAVKDAPTTIRDSLRLTNAVEDPGYMTLSLISENKVDDLMFNSKMFQDHMVNDFRPKFSHADSSEIMITLNNLKNDILSTKNIRELESTDLRSEVAKQFAARRAELVSHLNASLRPSSTRSSRWSRGSRRSTRRMQTLWARQSSISPRSALRSTPGSARASQSSTPFATGSRRRLIRSRQS